MLIAASARGLIDPSFDTRAYATLFHAISLGRLMTGASFADSERWLDMTIPMLLEPLRRRSGPQSALYAGALSESKMVTGSSTRSTTRHA